MIGVDDPATRNISGQSVSILESSPYSATAFNGAVVTFLFPGTFAYKTAGPSRLAGAEHTPRRGRALSAAIGFAKTRFRWSGWSLIAQTDSLFAIMCWGSLLPRTALSGRATFASADGNSYHALS